MKKFTRIEPTTIQEVGLRFKRSAVIKNFKTDDGKTHEFTTWGSDGDRNGAAIAITPDGRVVTTYQFRAGPEKYWYDLPGGGLYDGEDPEQGVRRELKEETGYEAAEMVLVGALHRDAYVSTVTYYYLATGCTPSEGGREPDAEEDEQGAEVRLISIEELLKNAVTDMMSDPVAVLMAYDKLKEIAQ